MTRNISTRELARVVRGQQVAPTYNAPREQGAGKMRPARKPRSTNWRSFEKLARIACTALVEPLRIPSVGGKYIGGGKMIHQKTACDFAGTVRENGRSFVCDFKVCGLPKVFYFKDHLSEHQRIELINHGKAGAIAGLLIEATARREIRWASWQQIETDDLALAFDEMRFVGPSNTVPDLRAVIAQAVIRDMR